MDEVNVQNFALLITGRCNFACNFCLLKDKPKVEETDMSFGEFKRLIRDIKLLSHKAGRNFQTGIAGGEPFLHPKAVEMVSYAVKELGRENVTVTTNLSLFPTTKAEAVRLLRKMGRPEIHISIDFEHSKFGKAMPERIKALSSAAREVHSKIGLIVVAQNRSQQLRRWPREIAAVMPRELAKGAEKRVETYSSKKAENMRIFLQNLSTGKKMGHSVGSKHREVSYRDFLPNPVELIFYPRGRVFFHPQVLAFSIPQLFCRKLGKGKISRHSREKPSLQVQYAFPLGWQGPSNWSDGQQGPAINSKTQSQKKPPAGKCSSQEVCGATQEKNKGITSATFIN